jgi:hypothetical protein
MFLKRNPIVFSVGYGTLSVYRTALGDLALDPMLQPAVAESIHSTCRRTLGPLICESLLRGVITGSDMRLFRCQHYTLKRIH